MLRVFSYFLTIAGIRTNPARSIPVILAISRDTQQAQQRNSWGVMQSKHYVFKSVVVIHFSEVSPLMLELNISLRGTARCDPLLSSGKLSIDL